jgi:hypothetical protein
LPFDNPESDLEIVFYHDDSPINRIPDESRQRFEKYGPEPYEGPYLALRFAPEPVGFFEIPDGLKIIFLIQKQPQQSLAQAWDLVGV